jgi:hypothetical protein
LNETFGNPRDYEVSNPKRAERLFSAQRTELAVKLNRPLSFVTRLFSDNSVMGIKDFAEALNALGYDLTIDITKRKE